MKTFCSFFSSFCVCSLFLYLLLNIALWWACVNGVPSQVNVLSFFFFFFLPVRFSLVPLQDIEEAWREKGTPRLYTPRTLYTAPDKGAKCEERYDTILTVTKSRTMCVYVLMEENARVCVWWGGGKTGEAWSCQGRLIR